jgi:hypothetical protein
LGLPTMATIVWPHPGPSSLSPAIPRWSGYEWCKLEAFFIRDLKPSANAKKQLAAAIAVLSAMSFSGSTSTMSTATTLGLAPQHRAALTSSYGNSPPGFDPGQAGAKARPKWRVELSLPQTALERGTNIKYLVTG